MWPVWDDTFSPFFPALSRLICSFVIASPSPWPSPRRACVLTNSVLKHLSTSYITHLDFSSSVWRLDVWTAKGIRITGCVDYVSLLPFTLRWPQVMDRLTEGTNADLRHLPLPLHACTSTCLGFDRNVQEKFNVKSNESNILTGRECCVVKCHVSERV